MFNKKLEERVERLEELRRSDAETPAEYLIRKSLDLYEINWLLWERPKNKHKYYQGFDGCFNHNNKVYLITITEDKNNK